MVIETHAGAFAAVATLVVGADRIGTLEERGFIFGRMSSLPAFKGLDMKALEKLVADATEEVCTFPCEDGRVTPEGVAQVLGIVGKALNAEQKREAFRMAVDLARADGMVPEEQGFLEQLREGLGIDQDTARQLLGSKAS